ncbi:creatininase family protein [Natrialba swarupiae]|uniref:Creatininase family protein n=1 Tax=Natrialba swarupiae TaxID=2448032 RepID=A0A5D5AL68_9EURY|nr:creatininase family protein [Natrialba swarupiae]TYT61685.1 creatininase family protein [Natrialba swarupiae]
MFGFEESYRSVSWAMRPANDIRAIGSQDGSVLVVPVGSVEQHGYHLPVGTDTILATAVSSASADAVDDVPILVTPPIWCGYSPHHRSLGGTLTAAFDQLLAHTQSIVEAGLANGFDAVVLVNGHGGNRALVGAVVSEVGYANPDSQVLGFTYFDLATDLVEEIRDSDLGGMAHGGEFETSLVFHLDPSLVDRDAMDAEPFDEPYDLGDEDLVQPGPLGVYRPFEEYSESGAIGAPERASAEKGEVLFEYLTDEIADLFEAIHVQNR